VTIQFPADLPDHLRRYVGTSVWQDRTLADWGRARAEATPDEIVFLGDPARPSFASLLTDAEALARALIDLGIRPGDVISFQTPNWVEAAVINLAAAGAYNDAQIQGSYAVNEDEWAAGQHDYFCFVSRKTGQPLTGSVAVPRAAPATPAP
jgi:non-ribosomal peptide synthetase component F